jgi:hypothetical protein
MVEPTSEPALSLIDRYDRNAFRTSHDEAAAKAFFADVLSKSWARPTPVVVEAGASVLVAQFAERNHAISARPPTEHPRIEAALHRTVARVLTLA